MLSTHRLLQVIGVVAIAVTIAFFTEGQVAQASNTDHPSFDAASVDNPLSSVQNNTVSEGIAVYDHQSLHRFEPRAAATGQGSCAGPNDGMPWFLEQFRVRGEEAWRFLSCEQDLTGTDNWGMLSEEELEIRGWGQRALLSTMHDIAAASSKWSRDKFFFNQNTPQQMQQLYGEVYQDLGLRPTFPPQFASYWEKTKDSADFGSTDSDAGLNFMHDPVKGYLWSLGGWEDSEAAGSGSDNWADVAFHSYSAAAKDHEITDLNNIVMVQVNDVATNAVVLWILAEWPIGKRPAKRTFNLIRRWPDRTVLTASGDQARRKAATALLGTPCGLKAAALFGRYRNSLGPKVLQSITIFKSNACPDLANSDSPECAPTLMFTFATRKAGSTNYYKNKPGKLPDKRWNLGFSNPYCLLATGYTVKADWWERYFKARRSGNLDVVGNPGGDKIGSGPTRFDRYGGSGYVQQDSADCWAGVKAIAGGPSLKLATPLDDYLPHNMPADSQEGRKRKQPTTEVDDEGRLRAIAGPSNQGGSGEGNAPPAWMLLGTQENLSDADADADSDDGN